MPETKLEPQYNGDTLTGHLRNALQVLSIVKSRPCANPGMEHRATLAAYAELYAVEKRINNALVLIAEGAITTTAKLDRESAYQRAQDVLGNGVPVSAVVRAVNAVLDYPVEDPSDFEWSVEYRRDANGTRYEIMQGTAFRGRFTTYGTAVHEMRALGARRWREINLPVPGLGIGADDDRNRSL